MKKTVFTVLTLSFPVGLLARGWMSDYGSGCYYGYGGWIMVIITIAIAAVLIFLAARYFRNYDLNKNTPLDILKARYAKGEITKDEFVNMKNDLQ